MFQSLFFSYFNFQDALKCLIKLDPERVAEIAKDKIANSSRLAQLF